MKRLLLGCLLLSNVGSMYAPHGGKTTPSAKVKVDNASHMPNFNAIKARMNQLLEKCKEYPNAGSDKYLLKKRLEASITIADGLIDRYEMAVRQRNSFKDRYGVSWDKDGFVILRNRMIEAHKRLEQSELPYFEFDLRGRVIER